jgi:hypothetical protein
MMKKMIIVPLITLLIVSTIAAQVSNPESGGPSTSTTGSTSTIQQQFIISGSWDVDGQSLKRTYLVDRWAEREVGGNKVYDAWVFSKSTGQPKKLTSPEKDYLTGDDLATLQVKELSEIYPTQGIYTEVRGENNFFIDSRSRKSASFNKEFVGPDVIKVIGEDGKINNGAFKRTSSTSYAEIGSDGKRTNEVKYYPKTDLVRQTQFPDDANRGDIQFNRADGKKTTLPKNPALEELYSQVTGVNDDNTLKIGTDDAGGTLSSQTTPGINTINIDYNAESETAGAEDQTINILSDGQVIEGKLEKGQKVTFNGEELTVTDTKQDTIEVNGNDNYDITVYTLNNNNVIRSLKDRVVVTDIDRRTSTITYAPGRTEDGATRVIEDFNDFQRTGFDANGKKLWKDNFVTIDRQGQYASPENEKTHRTFFNDEGVTNQRKWEYNQKTGKFKSEISYDPFNEILKINDKQYIEDDGKFYLDKDSDKTLSNDEKKDPKTLKQIISNGPDEKDVIDFINTAESDSNWATAGKVINTLEEFQQGYPFVSTLLLPDTWVSAWREGVDKIFASAYLGAEYQADAICQQEFDIIGGQTAFVQSPNGLIQFLGHIEGDRSDPVPMTCSPDGSCKRGNCQRNICIDDSGSTLTEYFYKITYGVTAPSNDRLTPDVDESGAVSFNIVVTGPDKSAPILPADIELENGEKKKEVIVKYSPNLYEKVCIVFIKQPGGRNGAVNQVCNDFAQSQRSLENFAQNQESAPQAQPSEDW